MDVDLIPDFAPDHAVLLDLFTDTFPWDERMKARRTASFGLPYDYSGITYPYAGFPPALGQLKSRVDAHLGYASNNCLVNLYADGEQTLGYHADDTRALDPASKIAILSLGATRTLVFRRAKDHAQRQAFTLTGGTLLVMSLALQREWQHGLPRTPGSGPRISVTFRRFQV